MVRARRSTQSAEAVKQGSSFRISALLKGRKDRSLSPIQSVKLANLQSAVNRGVGSVEALKQFSQPLPFQVAEKKAQEKAESAFLSNVQSSLSKQLQTAESDFTKNIQSAISKQLSAFTIPTATAQQPIIIQTPMIESESQIKQEFQSPIGLIPIAIIGIILGAVLLG